MMKIPGIEGSYHLRTIKGHHYWYRYWYDPITKKTKCKREDPPTQVRTNHSKALDRDSVTKDLPKDITKELPKTDSALLPKTVTKDPNDTSHYEALYQNVLSLIDRCLQNPCPVKHQRPPGWVLDELLPLDPHLSHDMKHLSGYPLLIKLRAKRNG